MTRVFISSSLKDLEQYRPQLTDTLAHAGIEVFESGELPASGRTTLEIVKDKIENSDAVILIIGHRYGAIEESSRKSYTELEFEMALEFGKPVLIFLQDDDTPVRLTDIDRDYGRVSKFRDTLRRDWAVSYFDSPAELVSNVLTAVLHLNNRKDISEHPEQLIETSPLREQVQILRLLLSSPGDVSEERNLVKNAVFRFNQLSVRQHGIFIEMVRWEDMAPQIGPTAQNVVNAQIGKYELFSGIMWNRFGTPTEIAASGTEEEFNGALQLWDANRSPWITFYFCERPANFVTPEQLAQKQRVLEFRTRLQQHGITRAYITPEEFEEQFYQDLLRIVLLPEFREIVGLGS